MYNLPYIICHLCDWCWIDWLQIKQGEKSKYCEI